MIFHSAENEMPIRNMEMDSFWRVSLEKIYAYHHYVLFHRSAPMICWFIYVRSHLNIVSGTGLQVCVYQIESPCKNKAGVWLGHGKLHFITEVWSHRIANLVLEADQNRRIHNCPRGRDACDCESDFPPITFHVCWNNPTSMICFPWRLSWSSVLWLHSVGCLLMYNSLPVPI